jgi:hypothetical protein
MSGGGSARTFPPGPHRHKQTLALQIAGIQAVSTYIPARHAGAERGYWFVNYQLT